MRSRLVFALVLILLSCSTAPEFDRDNENDPDSGSFNPDISDIQVQINEDKTVTISWSDDTEYENAFIISKSLGSDDNFQVIGNVQANSTSFIDQTKELSAITYYRVSASSVINENPDLNTPILLDYGSLGEITATSLEDEITITWDTTEVYSDFYQIEYKLTNTTQWIELDVVDRLVNSYSFSETSESYLLDVRVSAHIQSNQNVLQSVSENTLNSISYNLPYEFELNFINEAEIEISFNDGSDFDDQFIIFERNRDTRCCDPPYTSYIALDSISANSVVKVNPTFTGEREFSIQAFTNTQNSIRTGTQSITTFSNSPLFTENDYTSVSENSFTVNWLDRNGNSNGATYHFRIELYDYNTNRIIDEIIVPPTADEYTFTNLDPTIIYSVRIHTYASSNPSVQAFSFQTVYETISTTKLSTGNGFKSQFRNGMESIYFIRQYVQSSAGIEKYDTSSETFETIADNSENHPNTDMNSITDYLINSSETVFTTLREYQDSFDNSIEYWVFITDQTNGTTYYEYQIPISSSSQKIKLIALADDNNIIYATYSESGENDVVFYKLNYLTGSIQSTHEIENSTFFDVVVDQNSESIYFSVSSGLWSMSYDGEVLTNYIDDQYITDIIPSFFNNRLYLFEYSIPYYLDIESGLLERFGNNVFYDEVFPFADKLLTDYQRNRCFYNINTERKLYCSEISTGKELDLAFYDPNSGQIHLINNSHEYLILNPSGQWTWRN